MTKKESSKDKKIIKKDKISSQKTTVTIIKDKSNKDKFLGLSLDKIKKREAKRSKNTKPSIDDKIKEYFIGSFQELRKVQWPKRKIAWNLTFAVIIFTVLFGAYTTVVDFGIKQLLEKFVLGGK